MTRKDPLPPATTVSLRVAQCIARHKSVVEACKTLSGNKNETDGRHKAVVQIWKALLRIQDLSGCDLWRGSRVLANVGVWSMTDYRNRNLMVRSNLSHIRK
jgi:hypothetical protein